ncbi:hypothetical protein [Pseudoalteromonas sp. H71]|uniref:hypothetical protein n=1 Tax=Pseudoalteromonas sp. H71 TaxID=1348395 RepID=UPI0007312652|nr:hypothetical protein [Pseudoalteromonas sp. H71]KTD91863.1 hypothetical protein ATS71_06235 [Pseudoalteromonas sp. H71]
MILEIHNSIELKLDKKELTENDFDQLSSLFRLRRKGGTFILAKVSFLEKLLKFQWSPHDLSNIKMLIKDQTQWSNWLKQLDFRVVLTSLDTKENEELALNSFPHVYLGDFNDCLPTVIAENINDVKFFKYMTDSYLKEELKIRGVQVSANEKLGGGSTIDQVIKTHQENNEGLAFCIVDSDKKHPACNFGETALAVKALPLHNLTKAVFTDSREIENLIPFDLMHEVFSSKHQKLKINSYNEFRKSNIAGHNPIKYIDFKKGLRKYIACKDTCLSTKAFWNEVLISTGHDCNCNCSSAKKCQCVVLDGFGSDLLKTIVEKLKTTEFKISAVEEYYKEELFYLCNKMVPFVIAPTKLVC